MTLMSCLSTSLKVIRTGTDRSATYDFLLTFHGNHEPISCYFWDNQQFRSKIANFSHPRIFSASSEWVPMEVVNTGQHQ